MVAALALAFVAFGHAPPGAAPDFAEYALPDGSLPDLCLPGAESDKGEGHGCDACRLTSGGLLSCPPNAARPAQPAGARVLRFAGAALANRSGFEPGAPPTAPPGREA
jgi:hypothetical protein